MLRKILLSGFGLVLIGLSRFGFNAVALNVFSEETAGALNVGLSLAILAALPVTTSLGATTVRFIAAARGEGNEARASWLIRGLFATAVVLSLVTALCLLAASTQLAANRGIEVVLVIQAIVVAISYGFYQFFRNVLYAVDKVGDYSRYELYAAVAFFTSLAALAFAGAARWLLMAFAIGYGTFCLAALMRVRDRLSSRPDPQSRMPLRPLLSFSAYALIGSTSSLGAREIAVLIAPDVITLDEVAYLGLCIALLGPLQFMPRMLRTVVFAQSAEQAGRGDRAALGRSISEVSHWLLFANTPLCAGVILLAGPVLIAVGGDPTPEHVRVLQIFTLAAAVEIMATPATNALPGAGNIKVPAWSAVAGLAAAVIVWFLTARTMGATGLALGLLVASTVKGGVPLLVAMKELDLRITRKPVAACALLAVSVGAFVLQLRWPASLAVVPLYVVAAVIAGYPAYGEVPALLRARRAARA